MPADLRPCISFWSRRHDDVEGVMDKVRALRVLPLAFSARACTRSDDLGDTAAEAEPPPEVAR